MSDKLEAFIKKKLNSTGNNQSLPQKLSVEEVSAILDGAVKKKDQSQPVSQNGSEISPSPSVASQNIDPFQQVRPEAPTVLTPERQEEYIASVQRNRAEMDSHLRQAQDVYDTAQGDGMSALIQDEANKRKIDGLNEFNPDDSNAGKLAIAKESGKSLIKGAAEAVPSLLESIAIGAKKLDSYLPESIQSYTGEPTEDLATYRAGKWIRDSLEDLFPLNKNLQNNYLVQMSQGLGQIAPMLVTGSAAGSALLGSTQQASDSYRDALEYYQNADQLTKDQFTALYAEHKGDEDRLGKQYDTLKKEGVHASDRAFENWLYGLAIGSTDALPIAKYFKKADKALGGVVKKTLLEKGEEVLLQGGKEGLQEIFQEGLNNLQAKHTYDATRDLLQGVPESGSVGFGVGAVIEALMGVNGVKLRKTKDHKERAILQANQVQLERAATESVKHENTEADSFDPSKPLPEDAKPKDLSQRDDSKSIDVKVKEFQSKFPDKVLDPVDVLPENIIRTFDRIEGDKPTDPVSINEASDWLYEQYKKLSAMKKSDTRMLTIDQIDFAMDQLAEDITLLENHKQKYYGDGNIDTAEPNKLKIEQNIVKAEIAELENDLNNPEIPAEAKEIITEQLDAKENELKTVEHDVKIEEDKAQFESDVLQAFDGDIIGLEQTLTDPNIGEVGKKAIKDRLADKKKAKENFIKENINPEAQLPGTNETLNEKTDSKEQGSENINIAEDVQTKPEPAVIEKADSDKINDNYQLITDHKKYRKLTTDEYIALSKDEKDAVDRHNNVVIDEIINNVKKQDIPIEDKIFDVKKQLLENGMPESDFDYLIDSAEETDMFMEAERELSKLDQSEGDKYYNKATDIALKIKELKTAESESIDNTAAASENVDNAVDVKDSDINTEAAPKEKTKEPIKATGKLIEDIPQRLTDAGYQFAVVPVKNDKYAVFEAKSGRRVSNNFNSEDEAVKAFNDNKDKLTVEAVDSIINPPKNELAEQQNTDKKETEPKSDHALKKAEEDLSVLKKTSPENKTKKYEASIKRLNEAKKNKTVTEKEFNDLKDRFDDVMADSRSSSEQATQARRNHLTTERIKPERRIAKNTPKKLKDILKDVSEKLKATLIYSKTSRRMAIGTYDPTNTLVKVRNAGDLDTAAHELGHLLDDRFNLLGNIPVPDRVKIDNQLKWYSDRGGSNPPNGLNIQAKNKYIQNEGFAEFIRAYIANPSQSKFQSPELFDYFENAIDPDTKKTLQQFSDDFLDFANSSYGEQILSNIENSTLKDKGKFIEWLKSKKEDGQWGVGIFDHLNAHLLNSMHIAEKAFKFGLEQAGISRVLNSENFEIMSRLFSGVNGKVIRMLENGLTDAKNKKIEDSRGNAMSLEWLISDLDNTSEETIRNDMDDVIKLLVAERTVEYAKKFERSNNLSGIGGGVNTDIEVAIGHLSEFDQLKNTNRDKYNRIKEAAYKYREFADAGLRYAVEKGRISEDQYQQIKDGNKYYVSLARTKEISPGEEPLGFLNDGSGNISSVKDVIKKAKGGTGMIKNPYLSLITNTVNLIKESDRNEVMKTFIAPFSKQRGMNDGDPVNLAQMARRVSEAGKNTKAVFIDGEKQFWQFDADVYNSISSMESIAPNALVKALSVPGGILRFSVTHFPVFALRNIVRDTQSRLILSRSNSGISDFIHNKSDIELFDLYGGSQAGFHLLNKNAYAESLGEAIHNLSQAKNTFVLDPRRIWKNYTDLLGSSETINRIAEFNSALKKAKSEGLDDYNAGLYAAYQARDLMDFALAGHTIRAINQIIPFTNAAVQGLVRAGKSIKNDPIGLSARMFMYTILPQMLIRGIVHSMGDNEEYEQLPAFQRDLFWNFRTPWTGDKWVSIPRPFELGLPSALVDRGFSKYLGNDHAFSGFNNSIINSLSPFDEGSLMGGLRPIIEIAVNRDTFRDNTIVPVWEQDKLLKLRKGAETASNTSKMISKAFGIIGAEADPRYIDHFIRSQASYYGDFALRIGDLGIKDSKFKFGVGQTGFFRDAPISNSQAVKDTYDIAAKLGVERSHSIKKMRQMIEKYYSLETTRAREEKAKQIYDYAIKVRSKLEKMAKRVD